MFTQTRGCFLISNNKFKADGKTAPFSDPAFKALWFQIPSAALWLFWPVKFPGKIDRVWTGGHQCKFWYRSSPLLNFPHLTMLIAASLSACHVKTLWFFFLFFLHHQFSTTLCKGQWLIPYHVCITSLVHKLLPACHQARNCSVLQ